MVLDKAKNKADENFNKLILSDHTILYILLAQEFSDNCDMDACKIVNFPRLDYHVQ